MLSPLGSSPRTLPLTLLASAVAPTHLKTEPFVPGNPVSAIGAANALLWGCSVNRNTALKYLKFTVAKADVTPAANTIGQVAAAREADGDVSGDLTITFGSAAGQMIDSIPDHTNAALASTHLGLIVLVNGVPYGRIVDAAAPAPAVLQFGMDNDTADNYNIIIGASTGADVLPVGTEIEVFIGLNIDELAKRSAAGVYAAGTALAASVPEERFLGVINSTTDTAGRSVVRLVGSDFVVSETAASSLVSITK
jgi:hypothetical protein